MAIGATAIWSPPLESDENKFLYDAMDVGTRNRQMSGPTAPQEPTTAGDRGTEKHNFLLRVGAEAVERRGIDGRHLRTRKERNEECEAKWPQTSSE